MRVALFLGSFPETSETFVVGQLRGLARAGHEVDVYAFHPPVAPAPWSGDGMPVRFVQLDLPRVPLGSVASAARRLAGAAVRDPMRTLRVLSAIARVRPPSPRLLAAALETRGRRYDVVHAHFGPRGLDAARLIDSGLLSGRLFVSFHGWDANVFGRGRRVDPYASLFLRRDAVFIANSRFMRGRLIERGCPAEQIVVLTPAVDTGFFSPPSTPATNGAIRLLSVGRLVEEKGIELGLRAFASVADRRRGDRYRIIGDGPLRPRLERIAERLGITSMVEFAGWLDREGVRRSYHEADILLFPSIRAPGGGEEGAGIALLEAQACGLSVIACDVGGVREMVAPALRPFLCDECDPARLAEAFCRLADDASLRRGLGTAARRFVCEGHDADVRFAELVHLYERPLPAATVR